jgi:hypothetical protein
MRTGAGRRREDVGDRLAPPPVSAYRSMMRSAVSLPPRFEATLLATIVSGIVAVSAPEASAMARSKPATF